MSFSARVAVLLLLANLCIAFALAVKLEGVISPNSILTDVKHLSPAARVTLNGEQRSALIKADGRFEINDVAPGSYLLEVNTIDYVFPKLRVDVTGDEIQAFYTGLGSGWDNTGYSVAHPFDVKAKAVAVYFMPRQGFNVLGMFKNPMFLMLGFSGVMMFVMPKMLKNLDPDAMKEMSQSQADAQKMLSDMPSLSDMISGTKQQQRR